MKTLAIFHVIRESFKGKIKKMPELQNRGQINEVRE